MLLFLLLPALAKTPAEVELQRQLSLRDNPPSCEILQTQHDDLQEKLKRLVVEDVKPSYVPMRAARCLLQLFPEDLETYRVWVAKKETLGLTRLTVSQLEMMPREISVSLVEGILQGENATTVLPQLEKIDIPEIHSVLQQQRENAESFEQKPEQEEKK